MITGTAGVIFDILCQVCRGVCESAFCWVRTVRLFAAGGILVDTHQGIRGSLHQAQAVDNDIALPCSTRDSTSPRSNSENDLSLDGEDANSKRCISGNMSMRYLHSRHFVVCPPLVLKGNCFAKSSLGGGGGLRFVLYRTRTFFVENDSMCHKQYFNNDNECIPCLALISPTHSCLSHLSLRVSPMLCNMLLNNPIL